MNWGTFLSSTVIASIVSVLITYITFKRTEENKYITGERKEWREKMRDISSELHGASYEKTLFLLTELKVRINAWGNSTNKECHSFFEDSHIWEIIDKLEEKRPKKDFLRLKQKQLIEYISVLLKYDWERSKKEIKGYTTYNIISYIMIVVSALVVSVITFYDYTKASNNGYKIFVGMNIGTCNIFYLGLTFIILYVVKKNLIDLIKKKKITANFKGVSKSVLATYLKCGIGFIIMWFIDIIIFKIMLKYEFISYESYLFLFGSSFIGLALQYISQNNKIENCYNYIIAINEIKDKYNKK